MKLGNLQTQWLSDLRVAETADISNRVSVSFCMSFEDYHLDAKSLSSQTQFLC